MKTANQIRKEFLNFFKEQRHEIVPSGPVVPHGDPTLLFTNAGMNQFKDVFLGTGTRPYKRAADTQKCIRVSGKHNDLEAVGRDNYHHTFFEMLGNWSFGDYFKKEAIRWAWELLTKVWGIPQETLWATVFGGDEKEGLPVDEEAEKLWAQETGIPTERILRFGKKDNFWEMGETGPCGPCTEIHVDFAAAMGKAKPVSRQECGVNKDDPRFIEIWNLVFIQFNRQDDGKLVPLPARHVDTGMGFERVLALLQGKDSNYDTDLFSPIISEISSISKIQYERGYEMKDIAFRVIADHIRTLSVALADGALPSNSGRGYVLRRIMRRAARFGRQGLSITEPFIYRLVPVVAEIFQEIFPEIRQRQDHISLLVKSEEESFNRMLDRGIHIFGQLVEEVQKSGSKEIPGSKAYQLYHQDGFPRDLVDLMAREQGLAVDDQGWQDAEKEHKDRSAGKQGGYDVNLSEIEGLPATKFVGYSRMESNARVVKLIGVDRLILDQTPFYAESGGQVGDTGVISTEGFKFVVTDTRKFGDIHVHFGELEQGDLSALPHRVTAYVDKERRLRIMANHTATHLLHWALRKVLGTHVAQQGSLVTPERLRFDISHPKRVTEEEIAEVEKLINARIADNLMVRKEVESLERAKKKGAMALFGEKYESQVRVVSIAGCSKELCGGTHVYATGDIAYFRIVSESAVQAGVRRIEAVTRDTAVLRSMEQENILRELQKMLRTNDLKSLPAKIVSLQEEVKKLKKEGGQQTQKDIVKFKDELLEKAASSGDVRVVVEKVEGLPPAELRNLADLLRKASTPAVGIIASVLKDKVFLVAFIGDKVPSHPNLHAGNAMKEALAILGGGGDTKRAEFAQGQGTKVDQIDLALDRARQALEPVNS